MTEQNDQNETPRIMVVDDEEMVLTALASSLTLEGDYEVVTFTSPGEALAYFRSHEVDLVISDFLMPEMDGLEFLASVRDMRPEIPRIILTGYADKENAIKAINEIGLYQYIEKPWNNSDIHLIIRNGLERQRLLKNIQSKIEEINSAYSELQKIQKDILKAFI